MLLEEKDTVRALAMLRNNAAFKQVIKTLSGQLAKEFQTLPFKQDEPQLRQAQGRCQVMMEILGDYDKAPEILEKLEVKEPRSGIPAPPLNDF